MAEYVEERTRIMGLGRPNSAQQLVNMKIDIEHYLRESGVAPRCETEATGNPLCMLYVSGNSPETVETIKDRLEDIFLEGIRYGGETAYQIQTSEDTVVLDFATSMEPHLMVTGCIAINCGQA